MIRISEDEFEELQESHGGICRACQHQQIGGVEPDARNYLCESCGANELFGAEELILMGEIEFTNGDSLDELFEDDSDDEDYRRFHGKPR